MNHKAIIFNCSYNGLSIIQELSKHGVECVAMDCFRGIGTYSRYARFVRCPDPILDEEAFVNFLYDFCKVEGIKPVLFPTNDEWALAVSKYKKKLSNVAIVCVGDHDCVNLVLNKDQFYAIGQEKSYMTPKTWAIDDIKKIRMADFPIVAKAKYKSLTGSKKVNINKKLTENRLVVLETGKEFHLYLENHKDLIPHLVFQEFVRGNSDCMYTIGIYVDQHSEIKALFKGRKVRGYPATHGDNVVGESCTVPELIINNTARIVKDLNYTGIAEFEYKKDAYTGEFKLIEINPRSWSWIGITPYTGINIPLIAYRDLCGIEEVEAELIQTEENVRYIKVYQDFLNCLIRYRYMHPEWAMSFREWMTELKSTKNVYAELHRKDYLVSIVSVLYVIAKIYQENIVEKE
jgi:predicted ATP-grasp superfamily ATP-dependent carboligase